MKLALVTVTLCFLGVVWLNQSLLDSSRELLELNRALRDTIQRMGHTNSELRDTLKNNISTLETCTAALRTEVEARRR